MWAPTTRAFLLKCSSTNFPNRDELLLWVVLALPKDCKAKEFNHPETSKCTKAGAYLKQRVGCKKEGLEV